MYHYVFDVSFIRGLPATPAILGAIVNSTVKFNTLKRAVFRHLTVNINARGGLTYYLTSSVPISKRNWLRSCSYFSKMLSKEPGMASYICSSGLLKQ